MHRDSLRINLVDHSTYVLDFIFVKVLDKVEIGYRIQSQSVELSVFTFVRDGSYDDPRERSSSPP